MRVIIIGAGPAGLSAARIAASRGKEIIMIERGEHFEPSYSPRNQSLKNDFPPTGGVGGTAKIWAGQLIPLTRKDFQHGGFGSLIDENLYRKYVNTVYSWFYLTRAKRFFFEATQLFPKLRQGMNYSFVLKELRIENFFKQTLTRLESGSFLKNEVERIELRDDCSAKLILKDGTEFPLLERDILVLSAGTMGNTRLLLKSNLKTKSTSLGQNLCDHPCGIIGQVVMNKRFGFFRLSTLKLSSKYSIRIKYEVGDSTTSGNGCFEIHPLSSSIGLKDLQKSLREFGVPNVLLDISVRSINFMLALIPLQPWRIAYGANVWMQYEQSNRPESSLIYDGSTFQYNWKLGHSDLVNYNRNVASVERKLRRRGRTIQLRNLETTTELNDWATQANHPSGTISDARIISTGGISSLLGDRYKLLITGGAIFPRASWVNPTLTVMAITAFGLEKLLSED